MKRIVYSLLPDWAIRIIRRRREASRQYRLAVREFRPWSDCLDP